MHDGITSSFGHRRIQKVKRCVGSLLVKSLMPSKKKDQLLIKIMSASIHFQKGPSGSYWVGRYVAPLFWDNSSYSRDFLNNSTSSCSLLLVHVSYPSWA